MKLVPARCARILRSGALASAALALTLPAGAAAATIPVTTSFDENGGSGSTGCALREAIMAANSDTAVGGCPAGSGVDTVTVPGGTYALTIEGADEDFGQMGDLDVAGPLTLTGAGAAATVIDAGSTATSSGGARDRVFDVRPTPAAGRTTATIEQVTIRGGRTAAGANGAAVVGTAGSGAGVPGGVGEGVAGQPGAAGGGVRNLETLTLRAVTVTGNTTGAGGSGGQGMGGSGGAGGPGGLGIGGAGGRGGDGGGIATFGPLTLESSTVSGNRTGGGGRGGQAIGGVGNAGGDGGGATGGLGARAGDGGGIAAVAVVDRPEVTIVDSRITGNATGAGGAGGIGSGTFGADGVGSGDGGSGGNARGGAGGAGGDGGGVSGAQSISGTTIEDNTTGAGGNGGGAQGGLGGDGAGGGGGGGGGGDAVGNNGGRGGAGGGAMDTVAITSSTVADNATGAGGSGGSATGGAGGAGGGGPGGDGAGGRGGAGGDGGGLASPNQPGRRTVAGSTLTGNVTGDGGNGAAGIGGMGSVTAGAATGGDGGAGGGGGGLQTRATGTEVVTNVTIVGNGTGAGGNGAGSGNGGRGGSGGAISGKAFELDIVHGTVGEGTLGPGGAGATAGFPGGSSAVAGSGVKDEVTTVANTILLGSCSSAADGGNNLDPAGGSCPGAPGDPLLGPLADNGGPTRTRAPEPGSAALDAVPAGGAGCPPTDQRGATRPGGAACEIGAYEVAPPGGITGPAEDIALTGARLTGTVEPRGLATSFRFDYGPTPAYGNATPTSMVPATAAAVPVSAAIGGLAPETTVHYRLVAIGPDGTTLGADRTFTTIDPTAPRLTAVSLSRKRFGLGRDPTPVNAAQRRLPRGTRIRFNLSETASVAIAVQRRAAGLRLRRRGGGTRCVAPTPRRRTLGRQVRCVRFIRRGTLTRSGQAGRNAVRFSGRIGRRALRPGRHRFSLVATDPQGNRSAPRRVSFRIERTPRK